MNLRRFSTKKKLYTVPPTPSIVARDTCIAYRFFLNVVRRVRRTYLRFGNSNAITSRRYLLYETRVFCFFLLLSRTGNRKKLISRRVSTTSLSTPRPTIACRPHLKRVWDAPKEISPLTRTISVVLDVYDSKTSPSGAAID